MELKQLVKGTAPEPSSHTASQCLSVSGARDMDTVLSGAMGQLEAYPSHNVLACKVCLPAFKPDIDLDSSKPTQPGVLRYNFNNGTSFPRPITVPREFSRLKDCVKAHLSSKRHLAALEKRDAAAARDAAEAKKRKGACRNSLLAAYFVLKYSLPYVLYENTIVICDMMGANMGDLCHSATQMQRFRGAFAGVILDAVTKHVERAPCVALVADKVTIHRRTVDVTGIITLIPEAPHDSMIQPFVVGSPVVQKHDGDGLAEEWLKTVASVGVKDTRKLSAICTDGQYHGADVPAKFLTKLRVSHPDLAARSEEACVPCLWDGAHLLDLAESSAKKECGWVQVAIDAISRIVKRFSYGKGHEDFLSAGQRIGVKGRGLLLWSETRFSPYAARVVEAFIANIPIFIEVLEDHFRRDGRHRGGRASHPEEDEKEKDLNLLRGNFRYGLWTVWHGKIELSFKHLNTPGCCLKLRACGHAHQQRFFFFASGALIYTLV